MCKDETYKGDLINQLTALVSANLDSGAPKNLLIKDDKVAVSTLSDDVFVEEIEFNIPEPFRGWCHMCKQGFLTVDDLTEHTKDKHRIYKG